MRSLRICAGDPLSPPNPPPPDRRSEIAELHRGSLSKSNDGNVTMSTGRRLKNIRTARMTRDDDNRDSCARLGGGESTARDQRIEGSSAVCKCAEAETERAHLRAARSSAWPFAAIPAENPARKINDGRPDRSRGYVPA